MSKKNKILVIDIETAPTVAYVWRLFDENIGLDQIISPSRVICWGAKWVGSAELFFSDEREGVDIMLERLTELLEEADAVVSYNGDRFDLPKLMGTYASAGLQLPPPVTSIDLLKTVKKLGLVSNKLAYVAPALQLGKKQDTRGFLLWKGVAEGDPDAWERMRRYNLRDVRLTDRLYRTLRPYIKNHPYLGTSDPRSCSHCSSSDVQRRGCRRTKLFFVERLHCQTCGSWVDGVKTKIKKEDLSV